MITITIMIMITIRNYAQPSGSYGLISLLRYAYIIFSGPFVRALYLDYRLLFWVSLVRAH